MGNFNFELYIFMNRICEEITIVVIKVFENTLTHTGFLLATQPLTSDNI
jgi:hypothetical protein